MSIQAVLQKKLAQATLTMPSTPGGTLEQMQAAPAPAVVPPVEPGIMDKVKTMGGNAIDAVKNWAGKPGITNGVTGLNRGGEAAAVGGTLAAGALLAYMLRKKKKPQRKMAMVSPAHAAVDSLKAAVTSKPAKLIGAGALGAGAIGAGVRAATQPAAPAAPVVPVAEPGLLDKAKTMAGNAWDATKNWAAKPGITSGVTGMNRGTEAATGALAAGALLAYLLRKNKRPADDE